MRVYATLGLAALLAGFGAAGAHAQTSLYVYNFNDVVTTGDQGALFSVDKNNTTNANGSALSTTFAAAGISNFGGTTVNADGGDGAGQALALVNQTNNTQSLTATANLTGYNATTFSFATQRTATGFTGNQFQYSLDGTNFTNFGALYSPPAAFAVQSFDLSSISGLSNNANAAFRIVFNGASSAGGNNRIDNLIIAGTTFGGTPVAPVPEASSVVSLGLMLALGGLAFAVKKKKASVSL